MARAWQGHGKGTGCVRCVATPAHATRACQSPKGAVPPPSPRVRPRASARRRCARQKAQGHTPAPPCAPPPTPGGAGQCSVRLGGGASPACGLPSARVALPPPRAPCRPPPRTLNGGARERAGSRGGRLRARTRTQAPPRARTEPPRDARLHSPVPALLSSPSFRPSLPLCLLLLFGQTQRPPHDRHAHPFARAGVPARAPC